MRIALFSECYSPVTNGVVTSLLTLNSGDFAIFGFAFVPLAATP